MLTTRQKIALASAAQMPVMAARAAMRLGPMTTVRRRRLNWALDLREGIDFSIWLLGAFELATLRAYEKLIRPGDVVLDIGANIGAHTLHLARVVGPHGKVFAFEPTDYAFAKLAANIALNPELADRVVCCQLMLVDTVEGFEIPALASSWPLRQATDQFGRQMPTTNAKAATLDRFLDDAGVTRVDFVKLDIDGHECRMLRGAKAMLKDLRPTILLELSPGQLDAAGGSIEDLVDLLAVAGYSLEDVRRRAPLPMNGAAIRSSIPHGAGINAIARPPPSFVEGRDKR